MVWSDLMLDIKCDSDVTRKTRGSGAYEGEAESSTLSHGLIGT